MKDNQTENKLKEKIAEIASELCSYDCVTSPEEIAGSIIYLIQPLIDETKIEIASKIFDYINKNGNTAYIYEGTYEYDTKCDNQLLLDLDDFKEFEVKYLQEIKK